MARGRPRGRDGLPGNLLYGGLLDDDDLDALEEQAEMVDLLDKSLTIRREIALRQKVKPRILEIVRDLLTEGEDVDAVGILANELGLISKGQPHGIWGFRAPGVIPPGKFYSFHTDYTGTRTFQPIGIGLNKDLSSGQLLFFKIIDMADKRDVLDAGRENDGNGISAEFFGRYVSSIFRFEAEPDTVKGYRGVTIVPTSGHFSYGVQLPFDSTWKKGVGGLHFTVVNRTDRDLRLEGFVDGYLLEGESSG